ncbi:hypothetical protein H4217_007332, partial [Coemansia sp. RSA 1939]
MGLGDELRKYIPHDFGKKKEKHGNRWGEESRAEAPEPEREPEMEPEMEPEVEPGAGAVERPAESTRDQADASSSRADDEPPPTGQHIMLRGHTKAVSALAWDPSGAVLVSGEHGAQVRIWDFSQVESSIGSSSVYETRRTVEAWGGQQTHAAAFNRTGRVVACATGDPRAKLLALDGSSSRGGTVVNELPRGDMYIRDLRRTTGHVAPLTSVDWHPLRDDELLTAGADSTVRIWNCERPKSGTQLHVIVPRARSAGRAGPSRVPVTACAYAADGSAIAAAHADGSLALWPARGPFLRPIASTMNGTTEASDAAASCVAFSPDSRLLATRSSDRGGSVRVWDVRSAKAPVAAVHALPCAAAEASVAFSPAGRHLLAGVDRGGGGALALLRADSLAVARWIEPPFASSSGAGGVVRALWHPRANQIAVASAAGDIAVMYDDAGSHGGALLCAGKKPRRRRIASSGEAVAPGAIVAPHALPLFRDDSSALAASKRRAAPGSANRPRPPPAVAGHGRGGSIG